MDSPPRANEDSVAEDREHTVLVDFDAVYNAELTPLVRMATFLVGSQAVAEEAVHDAFVRLHGNWDTVQNPGGFVRTATVNRCRDILRRRTRAQRHLRTFVPRTGAEHHYLIDALQELPEVRRAVVVLRFYGNYKLKEISELLNLPEGTVRSNLSRGLSDLREALQ